MRLRRKYTASLKGNSKSVNDKVLTLLGFASKAGKLEYGMANARESIKKNKAKLIVYACDLSVKSQKEIVFFAHNKSINSVILKNVTAQELSSAVGRKCGIISVNDNGFAGAIFKTLGGYANDQ